MFRINILLDINTIISEFSSVSEKNKTNKTRLLSIQLPNRKNLLNQNI